MKPAIGVYFVAMLLAGCSSDDMSADDSSRETASEFGQSDRAWLAATERGDTDALTGLLASDFEWIDTRGRSHTVAETLESIAGLAAAVEGEASTQTYDYGHLAVITSERPGERLMRVWALQPEGWRMLALIGTELARGATPFAATMDAQGRDCDNPCRSMPFAPRTDNERAIADLFMQLKMDEWHPNPERWAPYVLDGVFYTTATAQLSKEARVEHLRDLQQSGEVSMPGDPVVTMRIVDLGDSAVMLARHDPYRGGQPYLSVRVWAFRDGRWQLANTQQTAIADALRVPPR